MTINSPNRKIRLLVVVFCFFFSCNNNIVFSEFQPVQDKIWDKQTEYVFYVDMKDIAVPYNITLQLRHNRLYPYQNLGLILEEWPPSAQEPVKDTIEWRLADHSGKWKGNGIALFQNQFLLRKNYHFPDTGHYTVSIRHAMRDDRLKGIENIGLLIESVSKNR